MEGKLGGGSEGSEKNLKREERRKVKRAHQGKTYSLHCERITSNYVSGWEEPKKTGRKSREITICDVQKFD